MRTTITLEPDTLALIRKRMREHGVSFKQVVNDAIVAGLTSPSERKPFRTKTFDLGVPLVDLDKALQTFGALEDAHQLEVMRRADDDPR